MSDRDIDFQSLADELVVQQAQKEIPHVTLAFEELIKRYEKTVYAICLRYFGNPELAEEVSQETFLKLFQNLSGFKGDSKFSTWLYRVTVNACHSSARKNVFTGNEPIENLEDDIDFSEVFQCDDENDCIQYCINQQKEQEKAIISMRFNTELGLQEIADVLQIKLSATKMRLYRAIEGFKALYEKYCR
jgi:RNA polymerase sigma-70 factor (ECF subfamily)